MSWEFLSGPLDFIKETACTVIDAVEDITTEIATGVAAGFKAFTGEDKFIEAKKLLTELQEKAEKAQSNSNKDAMEIENEISSHLNEINSIRQNLKDKDFNRFARLTSLFSEWVVEDNLIGEIFQIDPQKMNLKLSEEELFTIDFDKNRGSTILKAIFTLGFPTRNAAAETLARVKDQEFVLDAEIKRLKTEKMRLKKVCSGLKEIVDYFRETHTIYTKLLDELEYSVHLLKSISLAKDMTYFDDKIDVYFLPERHLLCLIGIEKMTRILYTIGSYRYFDSQKADIDDNDFKNLKHWHLQGHEIFKRIAA